MKVFISFSGARSRAFAETLRDCLEDAIQCLEPFLSQSDLEGGERWSTRIATKLEECEYGFICLTKENLESPWINFEAGALTKHSNGRAAALLLDCEVADVQGPLQQFQNCKFGKESFYERLVELNDFVSTKVKGEKLKDVYEKIVWPKLEKGFKDYMSTDTTQVVAEEPTQTVKVLDELLGRIRNTEIQTQNILDLIRASVMPESGQTRDSDRNESLRSRIRNLSSTDLNTLITAKKEGEKYLIRGPSRIFETISSLVHFETAKNADPVAATVATNTLRLAGKEARRRGWEIVPPS